MFIYDNTAKDLPQKIQLCQKPPASPLVADPVFPLMFPTTIMNLPTPAIVVVIVIVIDIVIAGTCNCCCYCYLLLQMSLS